MYGGGGAVVLEAVVSADDAKPNGVAFLVEHLQPLGGGVGGETRYHLDLPETPHAASVPGDHAAATEEVLVRLGLVEAAD